jgi:hypothetical protein
MSIPIVKIPLSGCIVKGDTVSKIRIVMSGDFSDDLTSDHIIRMQVKQGNEAFIDIDSDTKGGITIVNATTFDIDEVTQNNYPIGSFDGDLQIEKYSGSNIVNVTTYFRVRYNTVEEITVI